MPEGGEEKSCVSINTLIFIYKQIYFYLKSNNTEFGNCMSIFSFVLWTFTKLTM